MGQAKKDASQRSLGLERIERLFKLAAKDYGRHPERSHRNVQLARKIAMRYSIRMPKKHRLKYCKKCYKYLPPNIKREKSKGRETLVIKCVDCGFVNRVSLSKKKTKGE